MTDAAAPYITRINNVKEVNLFGAADLPFWQARLKPRGLTPYDDKGQALLLLAAADLRWLGIRFQEFTVSVVVSRQEDGRGQDASYLVAATNSSRPLAWAERNFFDTPYDYGLVQLEPQPPASLALGVGSSTLLRASMVGARPVQRRGQEVWEGTIFLPQGARQKNGANRRFYARLGGQTDIYPFLPAADTFAPAPSSDAMRWLIESNFQPREWHLRADAAHARSQTFTGSA
ncbi:MAG: hypothetical protein WA029_22820 [Anaerolineae bacterium]